MNTITIFDKNDEEIELPAKYEVCSRCNGEGKHTNPSIDGNGITQSEMAEICDGDPDFLDNYLGGMYDVQCEVCKGLRVELVVDESLLSNDQKNTLNWYHEQQNRYEQEERAERKYFERW